MPAEPSARPEPSNGFLAAIAFLTRVPMRARLGPDALSGALGWFPLVGSLVGLAAAGAYAAAYPWMPSLLAATIAVTLGILVTGAFHEDGLADTADALGSGAEGLRAIQVMRDPRLGTYGTLALVVSVGWRVLAVGSLAPGEALAGLIAAHALGRLVSVAMMAATPAAVTDGLGSSGVAQVTPGGISLAALFGLSLSIAAFGWWAVPALLLAFIATWALRAPARRRIGGVTGDVLGAAEQLTEMTTLGVAAVAAWRGSVLWWMV